MKNTKSLTERKRKILEILKEKEPLSYEEILDETSTLGSPTDILIDLDILVSFNFLQNVKTKGKVIRGPTALLEMRPRTAKQMEEDPQKTLSRLEPLEREIPSWYRKLVVLTVLNQGKKTAQEIFVVMRNKYPDFTWKHQLVEASLKILEENKYVDQKNKEASFTLASKGRSLLAKPAIHQFVDLKLMKEEFTTEMRALEILNLVGEKGQISSGRIAEHLQKEYGMNGNKMKAIRNTLQNMVYSGILRVTGGVGGRGGNIYQLGETAAFITEEKIEAMDQPILGEISVEQVFAKLRMKISRTEFEQKIREKIDEFGGLLSEEGAAFIVASDLGVSLRLKGPCQSLNIEDLVIGMHDICLCARVFCINAISEFQRDSDSTGKIANVEVLDKTGSTRVVLWDDLASFVLNLNKGDIIEVQGGYIKKGFREGVEIHLIPSRRDVIIKVPETNKDLPEYKTEYTLIGKLEEEMKDVDVVGRIDQLYGIREFRKGDEGSGKVAIVSLMDETGEIRLCLWNQKADVIAQVKRGDIIAVESGYTKMGLNELELHSGWRGRVTVNPKIEIAELPKMEIVNLSDLKPGQCYNVSGVVTQIGEKRFFVKSDGSRGKLASFNLKDETAEIRVVLWDEKADILDYLIQDTHVLIDNGYVKEGMEGLELYITLMGQVIRMERFKPDQKIFNLEKGPMTLVGRYYQGDLIDESGSVKLVTGEEIEDGQLLRVKGIYDTEIVPQIIEKIYEEFPSLETLLHPPRKTLSELEQGEYAEVHALAKKVLEFDGYRERIIV
jgi:replication factor A1